jgi:4-hydroxybenzoate polyprenyltransferase
MQKILALSRPRFWIYILGPYILTLAIGYPFTVSILPFIVFCVYFTFPANILIYGINDLYDRETDTHNEKKKQYEKTPEQKEISTLKKVIIVSNLPFIIYAVMVLSPIALLFLGLFIICAHQYSAPPLRAKAIPFVDSIVSGILYVLPACISWLIIQDTLPTLLPILAGIIWSIAMHAYSAVPDIEADTKAHIKTGATVFGKDGMLYVCGILFMIASSIAYRYIGVFAYVAGYVYILLIILSLRKKTAGEVLTIYTFFPIVNTLIGGGIFLILLSKHLVF